MRRFLFLALLILAGTGPVTAGEEPTVGSVLSQADQLIEAGKAEQAYLLLAPLEPQLAGNYQYDYLLGLAALESGRPTEATLALERVLITQPNFAGARMDLARAYFALGDYGRAGVEFEKILALNPPKHAREVAERYLDAIAQRDGENQPTRLAGYFELGAGYDTNVNSSPDQSTIFIPVFGLDFNLDASNQETEDSFLQTAGGIAVSHRLRESVSIFGNIDVTSRNLEEATEFDQDTANGKVGLLLGSGQDTVKMGVHTGRFWFGDEVSRDNHGADIAWQHFYEPSAAVTLFAQHNRLRHADPALEVNDVDQTLVGVSWFRALSGTGSDLVFFSGYFGEEDAVGGRADGGKGIVGFGFGGQKALAPQVAIYGNLGLQYGDYEELNPAFQVQRNDQLRLVKVGASWSASENWSIRAEIAHYDNDSNIAINEYQRTDAAVTLRRDFR